MSAQAAVYWFCLYVARGGGGLNAVRSRGATDAMLVLDVFTGLAVFRLEAMRRQVVPIANAFLLTLTAGAIFGALPRSDVDTKRVRFEGLGGSFKFAVSQDICWLCLLLLEPLLHLLRPLAACCPWFHHGFCGTGVGT